MHFTGIQPQERELYFFYSEILILIRKLACFYNIFCLYDFAGGGSDTMLGSYGVLFHWYWTVGAVAGSGQGRLGTLARAEPGSACGQADAAGSVPDAPVRVEPEAVRIAGTVASLVPSVSQTPLVLLLFKMMANGFLNLFKNL
ncbi:hypothetical protein CDAR_444341 [Caerostris darwini]|uniref:Uncharacterized protein n=1 Tax=Caerostris darwini TaxID=1538125 RepID=A0AAV4X9Q1_9ARAC|nr:hypothetical protein CDAR_444341 [Caerostris darwini]